MKINNNNICLYDHKKKERFKVKVNKSSAEKNKRESGVINVCGVIEVSISNT